MSISITPLSPERLGITGDLVAELRIPYDPDEDRFHLAMSDGTLVAGEYDPEIDRFHFRMEMDGAGIARIEGETIMVERTPEWVTVGFYQADGLVSRDPPALPLFDTV